MFIGQYIKDSNESFVARCTHIIIRIYKNNYKVLANEVRK